MKNRAVFFVTLVSSMAVGMESLQNTGINTHSTMQRPFQPPTQPLWKAFEWIDVGPNETYTMRDREDNLNAIVNTLSKTKERIQSDPLAPHLKDPICSNLDFYIQYGKELQAKKSSHGLIERKCILDAFIRPFWAKEDSIRETVESLEKKLQEYYASQNELSGLEQQMQSLSLMPVGQATVEALNQQIQNLASQKASTEADVYGLINQLQGLTIQT